MADWYYADGDVQRGPVSREKLVQLIAGGQVAAADLVWTDTMSDWVPAGQVPGLITAGGGGARGREYDEEPVRKTGWEGLPAGTRVMIMVCGGGGLLVMLVVLLLYLLAPPEPQKPVEEPKPVAEAKPVVPQKPKPPVQETVKVYDFDPKSLTSNADKDAYNLGFKQAHEHIDFFAPGAKEAAAAKGLSKAELLAKVKEILLRRDTAIHIDVNKTGLYSKKTITSFGWRDGVKAWLKEHGVPLPDGK